MDKTEEIIELILHYLRGIWKFRWFAIVLAWPILVFGVLYTDQLEDEYTANTKVFIDSSSMLRPLLQGLAIQSDIVSSVSLISRTLLSHKNLERVARQLDLDIDANNSEELSRIVAEIKSNTKLSSDNKSGNYSIQYTHRDPEHAKRMVQTLLDILVEDTLGKNTAESDSALEFLDKQIAKYEKLLIEAETRKEDFKRKNVGIMSQSGSSFYAQLNTATELLEEAKLELDEAQKKSNEIQIQLSNVKKDIAIDVTFESRYQSRIDDIENSIDNALITYTKEHPEIINMERTLRRLQERKEAERKEFDKRVSQLKPAQNPVYQQLSLVLGESNALVASLRARVDSYTEKQEILKKNLDIAPKIEAELNRLNRDYGLHKTTYDNFVQRRETARISEDVESGTEQVKFRIVEPPTVPKVASFPNRPLLDGVALVASLAIGYGFSLLISFTQPVFYNGIQLNRVTQLPVIGAINKLSTPQVVKTRRRHLILFFSANILLIITGILFIYGHAKGYLFFDTLITLGVI